MSDGVAAVRSVLVADGTLTGLVPGSRIAAYPLPQNTVLPAIALRHISRVDRNVPNPGSKRHVRELVDVMIEAADAPSREQVVRAVRSACDSKFPTVSGIDRVTVHLAGSGGEEYTDGSSIYGKIQTIRVTYSEAR